MTKEKWWKTNWAISIGTAVFSLLLTICYDYSKEKPILTTIWSILKWFGNLILTILNIELKVWWIIITITLFILLLYIIAKFKNREILEPDFCKYKEGQFKKWKWSWEWRWNNSKNAWTITNMKAHCPNCATPMIDNSHSYGLYFECPRCDFKAKDNACDEPHKIERVILDNVDRNERENR